MKPASTHVSWAFGRWNPPHRGHRGVLQTVSATAKGGAWYLFLSKSHDNKKNPLSYSDKIKWVYAIFPEARGHVIEDENVRTILQAAVYLYELGFRSATFVAGEDDMEKMQALLQKYNGQKLEQSYYNFQPLTFVQSPRITSATDARQAAKLNDYEKFEAATGIGNHVFVNDKTLMQAVRAGMGLSLGLEENFKDGKGPGRPGDAKRHGVPTKASVSTLRKVAKQGGRKGQLAHWMANMKAGKKRASESVEPKYINQVQQFTHGLIQDDTGVDVIGLYRKGMEEGKVKLYTDPDTWIIKESVGQVMLTEAMLREAFLDSVAKYLGDKVKEPVQHVNNMAGALQVLYRVVSDPQQLDAITFLLKKRLKLIIQSLPPLANKLKQSLLSAFPTGRGLGDFFKTLLLVAVGNAGKALAIQITDAAQDAILDPILQAILQIPNLVGTILSGGGGMLPNVLQALKIGNALWFDILNQINQKITWANKISPSARAAPALTAGSTMPVNLSKGVAEDTDQSNPIRDQLNAWMDQDGNFPDPTQRKSFQSKVWPYIQKNMDAILADKGEKGDGAYPAAPYAAWLLVQHMDAFPQNQVSFYKQLAAAIPNHPKLQFLKDRAAVNAWILKNADNPEYYYNGKPLPDPTVNVRNPAIFKDAGIKEKSREAALRNAEQAGNKLLVAAVKATNAQTQPSYTQQSESVSEINVDESWSEKYKRSIDCSHPKGFSQKAHCAGRKKHKNESAVSKVLDKPTPTVRELAKKYKTTTKEINVQLARGIKVEMEHTNNVDVAREIALDHLSEKLDYYKLLAKVEKTEGNMQAGNGVVGDRAVAVNPFDYYTPFMEDACKLTEANVKNIRNFASDPRLKEFELAFELEMVVPGLLLDDQPPQDFEPEPDYDRNRKLKSQDFDDFKKDLEFFFYGDFNELSALEDCWDYIQDKYNEWLYDHASGTDEFSEFLEQAEQYYENRDEEADYGKLYDKAYEYYKDNNYDDEFPVYLDQNDLKTYRDVMDYYNNNKTSSRSEELKWPYYTDKPEVPEIFDGRKLAEMFSDKFNSFLRINRHKVLFHRDPNEPKDLDTWYFEPDGSIEDRGYGSGIELTSPPMPWSESLKIMQNILKWARDNLDAKTGARYGTGFHINISMPDMDKIDYVKLVLMGGDDRVLREFGRYYTNSDSPGGDHEYAKSSLKYLTKAAGNLKDKTFDNQTFFQALISGLSPAAKKFARDSFLSNQKYSSINPKGNYIEFRSAGGDILDKFNELKLAALQFARAMALAADPEAEKKEYHKKLAKLMMITDHKEPGMQALKDFFAGKIDKTTLKFRLAKINKTRGKQIDISYSGYPYTFTSNRTGDEVTFVADNINLAVLELFRSDPEKALGYSLIREPNENLYWIIGKETIESDEEIYCMYALADDVEQARKIAQKVLGDDLKYEIIERNSNNLSEMYFHIRTKYKTRPEQRVIDGRGQFPVSAPPTPQDMEQASGHNVYYIMWRNDNSETGTIYWRGSTEYSTRREFYANNSNFTIVTIDFYKDWTDFADEHDLLPDPQLATGEPGTYELIQKSDKKVMATFISSGRNLYNDVSNALLRLGINFNRRNEFSLNYLGKQSATTVPTPVTSNYKITFLPPTGNEQTMNIQAKDEQTAQDIFYRINPRSYSITNTEKL